MIRGFRVDGLTGTLKRLRMLWGAGIKGLGLLPGFRVDFGSKALGLWALGRKVWGVGSGSEIFAYYRGFPILFRGFLIITILSRTPKPYSNYIGPL